MRTALELVSAVGKLTAVRVSHFHTNERKTSFWFGPGRVSPVCTFSHLGAFMLQILLAHCKVECGILDGRTKSLQCYSIWKGHRLCFPLWL